MRPEDAVDGQLVTGPYGTGILSRQANGWDLAHDHGVSQSIDLSEYEPIVERPPIVEIRTGDRVGMKIVGKLQ